MKLFCVVVGAAGSAFHVDIDASETVSDLKEVIKAKNKDITCATHKLRVYLAKKSDDTWLPSTDSSVFAMRSGEIPDDITKMLSEEIDPTDEIGDVFAQCPAKKTIHVLVVVPNDDGSVPPSFPAALPKGPEVDLDSCDQLLAFLEREMTNKAAIVSRPHILAPENLEFRLVGRDQAIKTATECYKDIIGHARRSASDRTQVRIPVCSGMSGLGKTRMLEEGGTILGRMELDPNHVARVIVPYFNGFSPQPVERSMLIEASFSWRLLYRFFLDMNCDHEFHEWFNSRLPRNGAQLTVRRAVKVIGRKLRDVRQVPTPLYLFLGVDEYQKIEKIGAPRKDLDKSLLRELVETIADLLCVQSSSLVLLPMFAGTDLSVIESGSIAKSSYYVTKRLPMNLLSVKEVKSAMKSNKNYVTLLRYAQVCRHLFILGGVPRWVVEYLTAVKNTSVKGEPVNLENIDNCFNEVWTAYVDSYLKALETPQLVRLAAYAVSGQPVDPEGKFDETVKWSRLRDSSLCLLIPRVSATTSGYQDVRVPYALLENISSRRDEMPTEADRSFVSALKDMRKEVDEKMFTLQPWQSWEMFGACFYAVRINALLALGLSTVTLRDLLPGTLMSDETSAITVKLVPSRVIRCACAFGISTPPSIPRKRHQSEPIDWASGGFIVLNDDGGAGVDIFFALEEATTGRVVVFVDQRKRQFGKFQPSHARDYLAKLSVCPAFLVARGARLVRGIMNCVSPSNLAKCMVPDDCFILAPDGTEQFHGTYAYHPACSPVISISSACKTALKTVFEGEADEVDQVVGEIVRKREAPSGEFCTVDDLVAFIQNKKLKVEVNQFAEFSC